MLWAVSRGLACSSPKLETKAWPGAKGGNAGGCGGDGGGGGAEQVETASPVVQHRVMSQMQTYSPSKASAPLYTRMLSPLPAMLS